MADVLIKKELVLSSFHIYSSLGGYGKINLKILGNSEIEESEIELNLSSRDMDLFKNQILDLVNSRYSNNLKNAISEKKEKLRREIQDIEREIKILELNN